MEMNLLYEVKENDKVIGGFSDINGMSELFTKISGKPTSSDVGWIA